MRRLSKLRRSNPTRLTRLMRLLNRYLNHRELAQALDVARDLDRDGVLSASSGGEDRSISQRSAVLVRP